MAVPYGVAAPQTLQQQQQIAGTITPPTLAATDNKFAARDRLAANVNQDRNFYNKNFQPVQDTLRRVGLGFDSGNQFAASQEAISSSGGLFDAGAAGFERDRQRLGLGNAAGAATQRKRLGLSRVLAQVDSANRASTSAREQRDQARSYGVEAYGQNSDTANRILGSVANNENVRVLQKKQANAAQDAQNTQLGATSLGLIAAMFV